MFENRMLMRVIVGMLGRKEEKEVGDGWVICRSILASCSSCCQDEQTKEDTVICNLMPSISLCFND
jgi:hypothetical protein